MTDTYQYPERPQDPVLRDFHTAVGELLKIISRRVLDADRTEAARIVGLLQEAAGAEAEAEPFQEVRRFSTEDVERLVMSPGAPSDGVLRDDPDQVHIDDGQGFRTDEEPGPDPVGKVGRDDG